MTILFHVIKYVLAGKPVSYGLGFERDGLTVTNDDTRVWIGYRRDTVTEALRIIPANAWGYSFNPNKVQVLTVDFKDGDLHTGEEVLSGQNIYKTL
jgi:hypothetical protein